jgi:V/A-type H+-transporting ATPase subunit E
MAEDIKNLIEKIQKEGIQAAQDKAKDIESKALAKAREIVDKAKAQADNILAEAKDRIAKTEESGKTSLKQAGRDLLISVRKEISALLDKIVTLKVREALNPDELIRIITTLVKECKVKDKDQIIISLNKADLEPIEKGLLGELKEEVKKGITLRPSEDISGGFIISYDSGKSHFDFTDKALAEYFSLYLKPKIGEMLNSGPSEEKSKR